MEEMCCEYALLMHLGYGGKGGLRICPSNPSQPLKVYLCLKIDSLINQSSSCVVENTHFKVLKQAMLNGRDVLRKYQSDTSRPKVVGVD